MTISNDVLNGRLAQLTVSLYLDYLLDPLRITTWDGGFGSSAASLQYFAYFGGAKLYYSHSRSADTGGYFLDDIYFDTYGTTTSQNGRLLTLTTDYIIGSSIEFGARLHTFATANVRNGSASASIDASHSSYWAGITSLSVNGSLVNEFNLSSDSGTDYSRSFVPTNEVPEPTSFVLFFIAIGLLALNYFKTTHQSI